MIHALAARGFLEDEPPDSSRHRVAMRRLGAVLAVASTLAMGLALLSAPQPAQAVTNLGGAWTVSHGGTGQVTLSQDGTYTSTCEVNPAYEDAWCPSPSGTFQQGSNAYLDFYGDDGINHSYRYSGLVSSPDTITSYFGSRTSSPLVMKKGTSHVCTEWTAGQGSPLVEYDAATNLVYATGSHELLGSADFKYDLAETALNFFQRGNCEDFDTPAPNPTILIDSASDASVPAETGTWLPQAIVTIKDAAGAPVAGATANGTFSDSYGDSCVTAADGTCTVTARSTVSNSTADSSFHANFLIKDGMQWDGHAVFIDVHRPAGLTPTYHISDLDNATSTTSGSTWQPKVTATVFDSAGVLVEGATVYGSFTNQSGGSACTTGADGTCTIGDFSLNSSSTSTVFTMISVIKSSSAYAPSANSDPDGDSNGTTITIIKPDSTTPPDPDPTPTPATHHVGDLDNATTPASSKNQWQPNVTVTVLDSTGVAVAGATVSGTFTDHTGTVTCVTAADGMCTLGNFSLHRSTKATVFTVTSVVKASSTYASEANTDGDGDSDGDSDGTSITVNRP